MILVFSNQKGGVGKTTSSLNLGVALANDGKKICLIDLDPQANLTSGLGYQADENNQYTSVYDLLSGKIKIEEAIVKTRIPNLDLIRSSIELAGAEIELVNMVSRETILRDVLKSIEKNYDYMIVDCPPSLGLLTLNALTSANEVYIPVQTEYFALEGLSQLMNTINLVKTKLNPGLKIGGVIMTMFDIRTNLSKQVTEEVQKVFGKKVYNTIIPRNIRLSEAPSHGKSIFEYDANSNGAQAFQQLAKEFISKHS